MHVYFKRHLLYFPDKFEDNFFTSRVSIVLLNVCIFMMFFLEKSDMVASDRQEHTQFASQWDGFLFSSELVHMHKTPNIWNAQTANSREARFSNHTSFSIREKKLGNLKRCFIKMKKATALEIYWMIYFWVICNLVFLKIFRGFTNFKTSRRELPNDYA